MGYTVDPLNRRVASASGGATTSAVAYLDSQRPVATFTSTGAVDEVYVYDGDLQPTNINDGGGTAARLPHQGRHRVPRGAGPQWRSGAGDRSGLGRLPTRSTAPPPAAVRSETDPGFQVIGYGGGIADPATSLVRFGARDYDTATGRWTAPDPLGIAGGSANLYTL